MTSQNRAQLFSVITRLSPSARHCRRSERLDQRSRYSALESRVEKPLIFAGFPICKPFRSEGWWGSSGQDGRTETEP